MSFMPAPLMNTGNKLLVAVLISAIGLGAWWKSKQSVREIPEIDLALKQAKNSMTAICQSTQPLVNQLHAENSGQHLSLT